MTHTHTPGVNPPLISNQFYNFLKWVALVFLPAVGVLYFGLAEIWGLPYAVQVMGTTAAIDTFLGLLLGISTHQYNKSGAKYDGNLVVDTRATSEDVYSFTFDRPLPELPDMDSVTLKVDTPIKTETTTSTVDTKSTVDTTSTVGTVSKVELISKVDKSPS